MGTRIVATQAHVDPATRDIGMHLSILRPEPGTFGAGAFNGSQGWVTMSPQDACAFAHAILAAEGRAQ